MTSYFQTVKLDIGLSNHVKVNRLANYNRPW